MATYLLLDSNGGEGIQKHALLNVRGISTGLRKLKNGKEKRRNGCVGGSLPRMLVKSGIAMLARLALEGVCL